MKCDRCHTETSAHVMSMFNEDILCLKCKSDERTCPNHAKAVEAEWNAVSSGNVNFVGIGLSPEDQAQLDRMMAERGTVGSHHD